MFLGHGAPLAYRFSRPRWTGRGTSPHSTPAPGRWRRRAVLQTVNQAGSGHRRQRARAGGLRLGRDGRKLSPSLCLSRSLSPCFLPPSFKYPPASPSPSVKISPPGPKPYDALTLALSSARHWHWPQSAPPRPLLPLLLPLQLLPPPPLSLATLPSPSPAPAPAPPRISPGTLPPHRCPPIPPSAPSLPASTTPSPPPFPSVLFVEGGRRARGSEG